MNDENFLLVIMMIPIWKISALIFGVCSGPESGNYKYYHIHYITIPALPYPIHINHSFGVSLFSLIN